MSARVRPGQSEPLDDRPGRPILEDRGTGSAMTDYGAEPSFAVASEWLSVPNRAIVGGAPGGRQESKSDHHI
jgi:hypothetical protein